MIYLGPGPGKSKSKRFKWGVQTPVSLVGGSLWPLAEEETTQAWLTDASAPSEGTTDVQPPFCEDTKGQF